MTQKNILKCELIFEESAYTDEPHFEHINDDLYRLYRLKNDKTLKEICKDLFMMNRKELFGNHLKKEAAKIEEDIIKEYQERKNKLKEKNSLLKNEFSKNNIKLNDLMKIVCDEEIYKMPKEFKITIKDGRYISYQENDIGLVLLGVDDLYYYYEYLGSEL